MNWQEVFGSGLNVAQFEEILKTRPETASTHLSSSIALYQEKPWLEQEPVFTYGVWESLCTFLGPPPHEPRMGMLITGCYFHGTLNSKQCDDRLAAHPSGTYLVRLRKGHTSELAVAYKDSTSVRHLQIGLANNRFIFKPNPEAAFNTIGELMSFNPAKFSKPLSTTALLLQTNLLLTRFGRPLLPLPNVARPEPPTSALVTISIPDLANAKRKQVIDLKKKVGVLKDEIIRKRIPAGSIFPPGRPRFFLPRLHVWLNDDRLLSSYRIDKEELLELKVQPSDVCSVLVGSMKELIQVQSKECTIGMVSDALMTRVRFPHEYSLFLWQGVWIKLELTQLLLGAGIRNGEVLRYDNYFSYGWVPPSPPPQIDQRQFVQVLFPSPQAKQYAHSGGYAPIGRFSRPELNLPDRQEPVPSPSDADVPKLLSVEDEDGDGVVEVRESGLHADSASVVMSENPFPMLAPEGEPNEPVVDSQSVAGGQPLPDSEPRRDDFDDPPHRGSFIISSSKGGGQDAVQQRTVFWEPAHRDSLAPSAYVPDEGEAEDRPGSPVDPIQATSSPLAAPASPNQAFADRAAVRRSAFSMLDEALEQVATQEQSTGQTLEPMDTFDMMELMVSQALDTPPSPTATLEPPGQPELSASQLVSAPLFMPKGASKALAAFQEAVADGLSLEAATSPLETESWRALLHPVLVAEPQTTSAPASPAQPAVSADLSGLIKPKAAPQAGRGRGAPLAGEPGTPASQVASAPALTQPIVELPPAVLNLKSQDLTSLFFIMEDSDLQPLRRSLAGLSAESLRPALTALPKDELIRLIGQLSALL